MNIRKLIEYTHDEAEGQPSRKDQIRVLVILSQYGYLRTGALKQSEISEYAKDLNIGFDCKLGTALSNLVEADLLDRFRPPGPDWYVISVRKDSVINGEFEVNLREDREALIDHIQDEDPSESDDARATADGGETLRNIVAKKLEIIPEGVEGHLRSGESGDQRERLNKAIGAIEEQDGFETRETYDRILLKPSAYRYHFSAMSLALVEGVGYGGGH